MRVIAFDVGARRTGVALSDASGTLASPLTRLDGADVVEQAVALVTRFAADEDGLDAVVVGVPRGLDGRPTDVTARASAFAAALRQRVSVDVIEQDERLTSIEAESRLASLEKDWRRRKGRLDAAAAAVILQEFLDQRADERAATPRATTGDDA
ncbi:MAG: yrrK [Acidobacteria bacterium]|jgi:putative Holliday junction resolvase|nr:yrrK [Acidobacteriota bacterium]